MQPAKSHTSRPQASAGRRLAVYGQLLLMTLLVFPPHLWAATIPVTNGTSAVANDGTCSLREAIKAANTDAPSGTAPGECPAGSGADTVVLGGDVTLTAIDGSYWSGNGLPQISSEMTLAGNGFQVTRAAGAPPFRFFEVLASGTLTLNDVSLTNGYAYYAEGGAIKSAGQLIVNRGHFTGNVSYYAGPAIYVSSTGSATLYDSTVVGNTTPNYVFSGAVFSQGGSLSVNGSEISNNSGFEVAGDGADITVTSSTLTDDVGGYNHDALGVFSSQATVTDSTLTGGIEVWQGDLTVTDSLVRQNKTDSAGVWCAIRARESAPVQVTGSTLTGGSYAAIWLVDTDVFLANSTLSAAGNSTIGLIMSNGFGPGAPPPVAHTAVLENSTLAGAQYNAVVGAHSLHNVILSNTLLASEYDACRGVNVVDQGGNFATDATCGTVPGNLTCLDPVLADNGGPTPTHALFAGSPAIDAGGACALATDQRGFPRDDGACDSGAYEAGPNPAPCPGAATPADLIELLIELVESLELHNGIENALTSHLEAALASYLRDLPATTVQQLEAFIHLVDAQTGKKIDAADAADLVADAEAIIALLGAP